MKKNIAILAFAVLSLPLLSWAAAIDDSITPQNCSRTDATCAHFLDTTSNGQIKWGGLVAGGLRSLTNFFVDGKMGVGTLRPSVGEQALRVDVEGAVGAKYYCDENGNSCVAGSDLGKGGNSSSSVTILGSSSIVVNRSGNTYNLSVSTSTIQSRITGVCSLGSAISTVNADGTVVCQSVLAGGFSGWASSSANIFNTNTGNVGIGTNNPLAKLDIAGNLRIVDGTQGLGKVLTSDANGLASWKTSAASLPACSEGQVLKVVSGSWTCANDSSVCVVEGGSLGAVVPGNNAQCCNGLVQQFPTDGRVGSRGICVKAPSILDSAWTSLSPIYPLGIPATANWYDANTHSPLYAGVIKSAGKTYSYDIPMVVPISATGVHVLSWCMRGAYNSTADVEIMSVWTQDANGNKNTDYLSTLAADPGAQVNKWDIVSDNMWFPVTSDRKINASLRFTYDGNGYCRLWVTGYR